MKKPLFYLQTNQSFKLAKTWTANLSAFYLNHAIEGNIYTNSISKVDIGIEKQFMKGDLSVKAAVTDLFLGRSIKADIKFEDHLIRLTQQRQSRMFKVSLTYRFRKGKTFKAKTIESSSKELQDRLQ